MYSFSAIYYLSNVREGLREFHRVLKTGGLLLISGHTRYSLFTLERLILRTSGGVRHLRGVKFHSTGCYLRLVRQAGFEILDVDGFELLWMPRMLERHWPRPFGLAARENSIRQAVRPTRQVPTWLKRLRSIAGYHFLIAARKM